MLLVVWTVTVAVAGAEDEAASEAGEKTAGGSYREGQCRPRATVPLKPLVGATAIVAVLRSQRRWSARKWMC